jgi:hypothetical protein
MFPNLLVRPRITSTSAGGTIPVCSLNVIPKPCEKYNVFPFVKYGLMVQATMQSDLHPIKETE